MESSFDEKLLTMMTEVERIIDDRLIKNVSNDPKAVVEASKIPSRCILKASDP
jgi:hypothetical protein